MGSPRNQNQSELKSDDKASKSRKIVDVIMRIVDWISWGIIAIFVWVWYGSRGKGIDCTVETCQKLYNGVCNFASQNGSEIIGKLNTSVLNNLITG